MPFRERILYIDEKLKAGVDASQKALLENLVGKVAIANARLTYKKYQELFGGPRWKALAAKGAQTQRLLWASTSTKNPKYRDVLYVEELIGADTVDTIPPATFDAFRDHGRLRPGLTENVEGAAKTMADLAQAAAPPARETGHWRAIVHPRTPAASRARAR